MPPIKRSPRGEWLVVQVQRPLNASSKKKSSAVVVIQQPKTGVRRELRFEDPSDPLLLELEAELPGTEPFSLVE